MSILFLAVTTNCNTSRIIACWSRTFQGSTRCYTIYYTILWLAKVASCWFLMFSSQLPCSKTLQFLSYKQLGNLTCGDVNKMNFDREQYNWSSPVFTYWWAVRFGPKNPWWPWTFVRSHPCFWSTMRKRGFLITKLFIICLFYIICLFKIICLNLFLD